MTIIIYVPSMSIKPQHNFLYTNSGISSYYGVPQYAEKYDIDPTGKLVTIKEDIDEEKRLNYRYTPKQGAPELYLYDVKAETSKQITFEEAEKFVLEKGPSSPDGYSVIFDENGSGGVITELVGGYDRGYGYVMTKGGAKKKITGLVDTPSSYRQLLIVGWIK